MSRRTPIGSVLTLLLAVLAGFLVAVPPAASAAPGAVPCGPTYDRILTGTPATAPRTVALTFDDGPSPNWTPQLLDILRRNGVKATFFLVGADVQRYPDIARRIVREGHTVGNHSWDHPFFHKLSRSAQARQMDRTTDVIRRATGVTPCVFRAPYGQASAVTLQEARKRGMSVVNWTHNTLDFDTPGRRSAPFQRDVVGRATRPWHDHAHVLMHDGPTWSHRQNTVDSLQRIIDHHRRHGYSFTDPLGRWSGTPISDHYNRINGEWALGAPVTGESTLPGNRGRATVYRHGAIYWSPTTGAHAVRYAIWERYRQLGSERSPLGLPVTEEKLAPDRRGVYQHFQGGSIYWTAATGAREVHGAILSRWRQVGWERGLGYPTTGELTTPDGSGRYNHFERGSIYWSPSTGAREVRGAIRDRWKQLGAEQGLGYPTSDERSTAGRKGVYQEYQRGSIYWSPSTGAREVRGAIRDRWTSTGRETGSLGYPTGNERILSGGAGRLQSFQGGHVYWSAATGAQVVVNGPIRDRWASLGWETGVMGYPTAGAVTTSAGSSQEFQRGTIAWTRQGGAQVLRGEVPTAPPEPTPIVPDPAEEVVPEPQDPSAPVDEPADPAPTQEQGAAVEGTPEQSGPPAPAGADAPTEAPAPTGDPAPTDDPAPTEAPEDPAATGAAAQAEPGRPGAAEQD